MATLGFVPEAEVPEWLESGQRSPLPWADHCVSIKRVTDVEIIPWGDRIPLAYVHTEQRK